MKRTNKIKSKMAWNMLIFAATLFQSVANIQSDIVIFPNSEKIVVGTNVQSEW